MNIFKMGDSNEYHLHYNGEVYRFEAENESHAYALARATIELADLIAESNKE